MRIKLLHYFICWVFLLFYQIPLANAEIPKNDIFYLGVKALIHNTEGKILLLQRDPNRLKQTKKICWDLPGGRVQINESLENALKREVFEETGLKNLGRITPFEMSLTTIRIPAPNGDIGLIIAAYFCEIEGDLSIHISTEHVGFSWLDPKSAAEQLTASNYPKELTQKIANLQL